MQPMTPTTLVDWQVYVDQLEGPDLWSKAIAANTQRFVDQLIRIDGLTMDDARSVIQMFALRIITTQGRLPDGGAYDLQTLAQNPAIGAV